MDEQTLLYVFELALFGIFLVLFLSVISGNYIVETAATHFKTKDMAFALDASSFAYPHAVKLGISYDPSFRFQLAVDDGIIKGEKSLAGIKAITAEQPFLASSLLQYPLKQSSYFHYSFHDHVLRLQTWHAPFFYQCPSSSYTFSNVILEPNTPYVHSFAQQLEQWYPSVFVHQPPTPSSLVIFVREKASPAIFYPLHNTTLQTLACQLGNTLHVPPLPSQEKTLVLFFPKTAMQSVAHALASLSSIT